MRLKTLSRIIVYVFVVVAMLHSVHALGVTPARTSVDFTADLQQEFSFKVINSEGGNLNIIMYPRGELAKYVLLEKNTLQMTPDQKEVTVKYKVNAPYEIRKPGINAIEIVIEETPSDYNKQTAINGKVAVVHQLELKAPFIGTYARMKFTANNPAFNEKLKFTYALFNDGEEAISGFNAELQVYDSNFKLVGTRTYEFDALEAGKNRKEVVAFDEYLPAGSYYASTNIFYEGKLMRGETNLVVGSAFISIEGIAASDFILGEINKVDLSVYNTWYEEIENLFAEVTVKDLDGTVKSIFKTISSDVQPFGSAVLFGYWDTSSIEPGKYIFSVKLNYRGTESRKEFDITVYQDQLFISDISGRVVSGASTDGNSLLPILVVSFIILMIANVLLIMYIRKGKRPPEQFEAIRTQMIILSGMVVIRILDVLT